VGLGLELLLFRIGAGAALSRWLRAEIGSPIAAAVITNMTPLVGLGAGWLCEQPFRGREEVVPYLYLRLPAAGWNPAGILGVGNGAGMGGAGSVVRGLPGWTGALSVGGGRDRAAAAAGAGAPDDRHRRRVAGVVAAAGLPAGPTRPGRDRQDDVAAQRRARLHAEAGAAADHRRGRPLLRVPPGPQLRRRRHLFGAARRLDADSALPAAAAFEADVVGRPREPEHQRDREEDVGEEAGSAPGRHLLVQLDRRRAAPGTGP